LRQRNATNILIHKASDFWIGRLATPLQRTFVPTSPQKYCGSLLAGRRGLLLWAEWRTGDGRCAAGCIKRCPLHLHLRCSLGLGPSLSAKCRAFRPAVCVELPFGERHCSRPWRHGANRQRHAVLLTRIELSPRLRSRAFWRGEGCTAPAGGGRPSRRAHERPSSRASSIALVRG